MNFRQSDSKARPRWKPLLRGLRMGILALSIAGLVGASQDQKSAGPPKPADPQAAATSEAAAPSSAPAAYVGSERTCLSCHKNTFAHSGRIQGGHGRNQVACVACHSMHKPGGEAITTGRNNAINSLCAGCHTQTWAEFQKPHKHFLPAGAMSCVDCHNPHGSVRPRMI